MVKEYSYVGFGEGPIVNLPVIWLLTCLGVNRFLVHVPRFVVHDAKAMIALQVHNELRVGYRSFQNDSGRR